MYDAVAAKAQQVKHLGELTATLARTKVDGFSLSDSGLFTADPPTLTATPSIAVERYIATSIEKPTVKPALSEMGLLTETGLHLRGGIDTHLDVLLSRYERKADEEDLKDFIALTAARHAEQRRAVEAVLKLRDDARADFLTRLARLGREDGFQFVFAFINLIEQELDARAILRSN
ncbi:hypothetical protein [Rathayibacter agropyri]